MKRLLALSLALVVVLTTGAGAVAAATRPGPTFRYGASQHAVPGRAFRVVVKAKHVHRRAAFSATAVVHFATGDVNVTLKRRGRASLTAVGRVRVPAAEPGGQVPVDVTVLYGGTTITGETLGFVDGPEPEPEPEPPQDN